MNLISQAKTWLSVKNTSWKTVLYSFMNSLKGANYLANGVNASNAENEVQSVMDSLLLLSGKSKKIEICLPQSQ